MTSVKREPKVSRAPKKRLILHESQIHALEKIGASDAEYVIGVDEVGLGSWAGPITVAAAVLPKGWSHPSVKDSKQLTKVGRRKADALIRTVALSHCILSSNNEEIDQVGIGTARELLTLVCIEYCLRYFPDALVVQDGDLPVLLGGPPSSYLVWLPKADVLVPAVSAASVLAKVYRDNFMMNQAQVYPGYGFETNVGYGSEKHMDGLHRYGLCPLHRRSYRPVKKFMKDGYSSDKLKSPCPLKRKETRDSIISRLRSMLGLISTSSD